MVVCPPCIWEFFPIQGKERKELVLKKRTSWAQCALLISSTGSELLQGEIHSFLVSSPVSTLVLDLDEGLKLDFLMSDGNVNITVVDHRKSELGGTLEIMR